MNEKRFFTVCVHGYCRDGLPGVWEPDGGLPVCGAQVCEPRPVCGEPVCEPQPVCGAQVCEPQPVYGEPVCEPQLPEPDDDLQ